MQKRSDFFCSNKINARFNQKLSCGGRLQHTNDNWKQSAVCYYKNAVLFLWFMTCWYTDRQHQKTERTSGSNNLCFWGITPALIITHIFRSVTLRVTACKTKQALRRLLCSVLQCFLQEVFVAFSQFKVCCICVSYYKTDAMRKPYFQPFLCHTLSTQSKQQTSSLSRIS